MKLLEKFTQTSNVVLSVRKCLRIPILLIVGVPSLFVKKDCSASRGREYIVKEGDIMYFRFNV